MTNPALEATLKLLDAPDEQAVSDEDLQALLAGAVRRYAARSADRRIDAFPPGANVTATDVMLMTTAMLRATDVQLFELGMWQTFSGVRSR